MCTVLDGDLEDEEKFMEALTIEPKSKNCLKCGTEDTSIVLRGKDSYCINCFQAAMDHKFRSTLGKSRLLRHEDNVLIIYQGGPEVSTMLKIIANGLNRKERHKKFVFNSIILYLEHGAILNENIESRKILADKVQMELRDYGFPTYISSISNTVGNDALLFDELNSSFFDNLSDEGIKNVLSKISTLSAQQDFLNTAQRKLVLKIAKSLNCKFVFYPDISVDIASKTLAGFALGRGSHITMDVGFSDTRDPLVTILRPMRDFSREEITEFCKLNELKPIQVKRFGDTGNLYSSIQNLADNFIGDLQMNFPSTIYTVIRTADKLTANDTTEMGTKCKFCLTPRDNLTAKGKVSALNAVEFSRIASKQSAKMITSGSYDRPEIDGLEQNEFCHGCNLTLNDVSVPDSILEFIL
ncbi:cytoplasmic tRNA 2-thiolation protein 2 [Chrysoperla carnea]|uniref:cytoplasmic tRNA 2-thiolation protein 2 n=1 Tax=Chrysoperla carnea TaxID=189513 RepID=UPI001D08BCC5|nr:cytoplasmic tRNA 2-thiolation protein 2 [Chrysoperla carnea]